MIKGKYLAIFKIAAIQALKNYKSLIGLSIFLITCLIIFAHLWKIAAARTGVVDLNPSQLLWYIAFNEWVLVAIPDVHEGMEEDLKSGRLAYLLPRPISYLGATFAEAAGTLSVNLFVLGCVTFLFTFWQTGSLPFSPTGLVIACIFGLMAGIVAIIFHMLIGLSAFWLNEVTPFYWIWEKLGFMLGGLMLPLAVYPSWLQTVASYTPFPVILGGRSALALDYSVGAVLNLAFATVVWGLIGLFGLLFVYRKGLRILNVEGG